MAQLTTVLANTHLSEAAGGPRYTTTVFDGATGLERRNIVWSTPRHVWAVTFVAKPEELADLLALFSQAKGQAYSFLWAPPGYAQGSFRFGTDELPIVYIGAGNVARIQFTLIQVLGE